MGLFYGNCIDEIENFSWRSLFSTRSTYPAQGQLRASWLSRGPPACRRHSSFSRAVYYLAWWTTRGPDCFLTLAQQLENRCCVLTTRTISPSLLNSRPSVACYIYPSDLKNLHSGLSTRPVVAETDCLLVSHYQCSVIHDHTMHAA